VFVVLSVAKCLEARNMAVTWVGVYGSLSVYSLRREQSKFQTLKEDLKEGQLTKQRREPNT
jgi:hypothetical protein